MRRERYDLGPGSVHVLESPDEVGALPQRLRALVPPRMIELWRELPRSFEELAEGATIAALASWLREAAASRASVRVYDPKPPGMPPRAFLELGFGLRPTAGGDLPWSVLVDCRTGTPPLCPPALAEVYERLGGLVTQYGASGTLVPPSEVVPLAAKAREAPHLFDPALGGELTLEEARGWCPWFEADGDYLCYRGDGMSRWFGFEWGNAGELVPTGECVEELFRCLGEKRYFHG